MRIVIKKADFSSVSIGKVYPDLSFSFDANGGSDVNMVRQFFPNYNGSSSNPSQTTYYAGTEGNTVEGVSGNGRVVSDFHQVVEGMTIEMHRMGMAVTTPILIAFDANKDIVSAKCVWQATKPAAQNSTVTYTVPSGVAFVKFQTVEGNFAANADTSPAGDKTLKIVASMPSE